MNNREKVLELAAEVVEIGFDNKVLTDSILKDIPIVGGIVKLAALYNSVNDVLFMQKLSMFLESSEKVEPEEKDKINSLLLSDETLPTKLIEILDKITDIQKAKYLANATYLYGTGLLDKDNYRRVIDLIQSIHLPELEKFVETKFISNASNIYLEDQGISGLIHTPILRIQSLDYQNNSESSKYSKLNKNEVLLYEETFFGSIFRNALNRTDPNLGQDTMKTAANHLMNLNAELELLR